MTGTPESGAALVEELAARYGGMQTYRDDGIIRSWLSPEDDPIEMPFETVYERPNRFRFAFDSPHPYPPLKHIITRYVVGSDGHRAFLYRQHAEDTPKLDVSQDLAMAVHAIVGVSCGASHIIARLLLPQIGGPALSDLQDLTVAGQVEIAGLLCHRVVGSHVGTHERKQQPWEIVIERDSSRLRAVTRGVKYTVQEHRAIRVDEPIDARLFAIPSAE